jgi:hypothetical protein
VSSYTFPKISCQLGLLLIVTGLVSFAQITQPVIRNGGSARFIEHIGTEKTLQGQALAARKDALRSLARGSQPSISSAYDKDADTDTDKDKDNDWAFDVGGNGPAIGFPGTYLAGALPDCARDYVAFTIHAQGTSTQANVVVLNNLYANLSGTAFCPGRAPKVVAAYNLGTSVAGNYLGDAWPSPDGTKLLILEKGLAGTSTPAKLHLITLGAGGGTVTAPATPPVETVLSFTGGGASCAASLSGSPSLKDVTIWYASGNAYTGDDQGRIYKISNGFSAPAIAYCSSTGSAPVTDVNADEGITGQPAGTNYISVMTSGKTLMSYSANSPATTFTNRWVATVSSVDNGVTDFLLQDGTFNFIYLMTNHDSTGSFAEFQQYDYDGNLLGAVNLGPASNQNLNMGAWDQNYQGNVNSNATFYFCTYPAGAAGLPYLSDVQFDSSWHMKATPTMTGNSNIQPVGAVNGSTCGSMLGLYFEDTSGSPLPIIDIIVGVGDGIAADPSRVSRWRLQTITTNKSPLTSNSATYQQQVPNNTGGISSYLGDWSSSTLGSNTYNFYFGTLAPQISGRAPCLAGHYCFVKLQVVSLN